LLTSDYLWHQPFEIKVESRYYLVACFRHKSPSMHANDTAPTGSTKQSLVARSQTCSSHVASLVAGFWPSPDARLLVCCLLLVAATGGVPHEPAVQMLLLKPRHSAPRG
jgi:hypothetical protein